MKPLYTLVLSSLLPLMLWPVTATAQTAANPSELQAIPAVGPVSASDVVLADFMFVRRPVVVFADSPLDPTFIRQMELLQRDLTSLDDRDVVVITDTDPAAKSELRQSLRPRGFSLVLMDKNLKPVIRKPLPWDVREISASIDKFPLRRQEVLDQSSRQR